jgi:hypothetical protein
MEEKPFSHQQSVLQSRRVGRLFSREHINSPFKRSLKLYFEARSAIWHHVQVYILQCIFMIFIQSIILLPSIWQRFSESLAETQVDDIIGAD